MSLSCRLVFHLISQGWGIRRGESRDESRGRRSFASRLEDREGDCERSAVEEDVMEHVTGGLRDKAQLRCCGNRLFRLKRHFSGPLAWY